MQLNAVATELTTAATDGMLAALAVACIAIFALKRRNIGDSGLLLWWSIFLLLASGAALGAVAHGLQLSVVAQFWVWQPLYLSIGAVVSLFVVAAVVDVVGKRALRPVLWTMLTATLGFYVCTLIGDGAFWAFVAYESVCMAIALAVYSYLAARGNRGATLLVMGISLSITAAVVQASEAVAMTVGPWLLNHNGVFHVLQMPALVLLALGVRWFDSRDYCKANTARDAMKQMPL